MAGAGRYERQEVGPCHKSGGVLKTRLLVTDHSFPPGPRAAVLTPRTQWGSGHGWNLLGHTIPAAAWLHSKTQCAARETKGHFQDEPARLSPRLAQLVWRQSPQGHPPKVSGRCPQGPSLYLTLSPSIQYGIVLDAGSSRTTVYVYQWPAEKENNTGVVSQTFKCSVRGEGTGRPFCPALLVPSLLPCLSSPPCK